ncbi:type II toxin-antitoxin system death-on-curing family toxin [Salsipaludibacter albus]|uniref:type II toxin-antitoxin system death-on-curing family toxin n=1 Tax=Salsipaludibacter albus TaxID=2849650 RepID=UPI001EE4B1AD
MTNDLVPLDLADALAIAELLGVPDVRDIGLLDAALHRPVATAFGRDAYPTLVAKAAALFDSLLRNHPLVDGNKRLAWTATVVFLRLNGAELARPDDDTAFAFVMAAAAGHLDLEAIIATWESWLD